MANIPFTSNYTDLSTQRGFQFQFFCRKCGNGYMSTFRANSLGVASNVANVAASLFGGIFGRAAQSAAALQSQVAGPQHDSALDAAVREISPLFKQCTRCGTWVCEPLSDVSLEMPASTAQGVLAAVGRLGGRVTGQFSATGLTRASAVLPVARVRTLQHQMPGLSMGEGILESGPGGYQPIGSDPPRRERSTPSPLDRDAWLASLAKRG